MAVRNPTRWRLPIAVVLGVAAIGLAGVGHRATAAPADTASVYDGPIADTACGAGDLPETEQGRVSLADVTDGRAAKGYTCNTAMVSHFGATGGFRVERYDDAAGHHCAYFDSTLLFPKDAAGGAEGPGTYVMDMTDPTHPVETDTLVTPAMQSPHESLRINARRGLLVADMGYPTTNPGFVDVYDVTADCRHPVLDSSTAMGILGHESGFSPDGKTFWVAGNSGHTLTAVDLTNPSLPVVLFITSLYEPHGVSISDDGNRMYLAEDNFYTSDGFNGLIILDTSQVQARVTNPQVPEISRLTWPEVSIPQIAIPITQGGHPYVLEDDEYDSSTLHTGVTTPLVGAGRVIDIADEKNPVIVSNLRLAVHQTAARADGEMSDPGASDVAQGYAAHYCSVPTRVNPTIMVCSMIVSGLRIFDIRDPVHPIEIGYFNGSIVPGTSTHEGAFAMSSANYDLDKHEIWYSDGNLGFYVIKLTGVAATIAGTGSTDGTSTTPVPAPVTTPSAAPTAAAPTSVAPTMAAPAPATSTPTPARTTTAAAAHRVGSPTATRSPAVAPANPPATSFTVTAPRRTLAFTGAPPYLGISALLALALTGLGLRLRRSR